MVVDNLYYNNSDSDSSPNAPFTFPDEVIRRALLNIYSQDFHPVSDIEQNLFNEVWRTLNIAADRGFSQSAAPYPDEDFRNAIRRSNAVFSAFKVHRMQNDMAQLLLDDDGNLKTFEQWRKEALPIASHQCGAWLRTEYDTAVIRAHQAADWLQFQREKDVLPNLRWVPSTSPNPGKDHRHFWNTILPIDDPFWTQHRPGDRWNCKCSLTSTDEPPTAAPRPSKKDRPQPGLDNNPADDQKLFADSHPYIAHPYRGAQKAVDKLMQQIEADSTGTYRVITVGKGKVRINSLVDNKDNDYPKLVQIAEFFAKDGATATLTPKMSRPPKFQYNTVYADLIGTKFEGKCPDLNIDGKWYEHEGFTSKNPKRALKNMLNHGLKQSNRLIIDRPELTDRYILRNIQARIKEGQDIIELWLIDKGEVKLLYKKTEE